MGMGIVGGSPTRDIGLRVKSSKGFAFPHLLFVGLFQHNAAAASLGRPRDFFLACLNTPRFPMGLPEGYCHAACSPIP